MGVSAPSLHRESTDSLIHAYMHVYTYSRFRLTCSTGQAKVHAHSNCLARYIMCHSEQARSPSHIPLSWWNALYTRREEQTMAGPLGTRHHCQRSQPQVTALLQSKTHLLQERWLSVTIPLSSRHHCQRSLPSCDQLMRQGKATPEDNSKRKRSCLRQDSNLQRSVY